MSLKLLLVLRFNSVCVISKLKKDKKYFILVGPSSVDVNIPELVDGSEGSVECIVIGSVPVVNPIWQGFDDLETAEMVTEVLNIFSM